MTGATVQKRALYPNGSRYVTSGLFVQDEIELLDAATPAARSWPVSAAASRASTFARTPRPIAATAAQSLGVVDSKQSYHDWTFNAGLTWSLDRAF